MSEMYGSYSDDDLNDWERLPLNAIVLTSSAFGAWLLRRDTRKRKRENTNVLDKIKAEIEQEYTRFRNKSDVWSERACGLGTALDIIDKYRVGNKE